MFSPQLPTSVGRNVERGALTSTLRYHACSGSQLASSYPLGQGLTEMWFGENADGVETFLIRGKGDSVTSCSRSKTGDDALLKIE